MYSDELPPDPSQSHYGFPHLDEQDMNDFVRKMPDADNVQIYGYNKNIERYAMSN